jgi:hypothetical protein
MERKGKGKDESQDWETQANAGIRRKKKRVKRI